MPELRTQIDGADVAIHCTDDGEGPPIVLVHGFPLDGRIWDDVVPLLTSTHRVIVPDLPGFGRSTIDPPAFSMGSLATSLTQLLESLDILRPVYAGLSMGGYVIQALVRQRPDRVRALSFVDTRAASDDAAGRAARDKMIALVREQGTAAVVEQMLPKMLAPETTASAPVVVARLKDVMLDTSPLTIASACAAMRDREDFTNALNGLPCPLQIIVGESDAIAPPDVARAMHTATRAKRRLDVIAGAGHMSPLERPAEVARVLLEFMNQCRRWDDE